MSKWFIYRGCHALIVGIFCSWWGSCKPWRPLFLPLLASYLDLVSDSSSDVLRAVVWLALPGNLSMRTNSCLSMPSLVLPKLKALQGVILNLAPDNISTAPFRRYRTHNSAGIESNVNYTDSFLPDPNILELVIVSSTLGVAIARYKLHQINKEPTGYFQGGFISLF